MDLEPNYDTLKKIKVSQNHVVKDYILWVITQPRIHQFSKSLCTSSRGGPEDSKTPLTCSIKWIFGQVVAIPKKHCCILNSDNTVLHIV